MYKISASVRAVKKLSLHIISIISGQQRPYSAVSSNGMSLRVQAQTNTHLIGYYKNSMTYNL
ncbi:hypothetical protein GCM10025791_00100 [Halioxenophilus aromaticivorans]|uniref:Uncharacterized protein n=1 Tax=Halioxenophilus aromaticivorans TaxID=1306992 RepID=A0AAV3TWF7_9ALTE